MLRLSKPNCVKRLDELRLSKYIADEKGVVGLATTQAVFTKIVEILTKRNLRSLSFVVGCG